MPYTAGSMLDYRRINVTVIQRSNFIINLLPACGHSGGCFQSKNLQETACVYTKHMGFFSFVFPCNPSKTVEIY